MKKWLKWLIFLIIPIILASVYFLFEKNYSSKNIDFLSSYGWSVDKEPIEVCEITIPPVFDEVYENYNYLQKQANLDLTPYCGMEAVRYTYILKNFPYAVSEQVRANVITVNGKPVAGDIMTVSLNGFMYSLNFNESVCFALQN